MRVDPALAAHVDEQRNFNQLVAAFMPNVPSFSSPEGLAELRANDGFFASTPIDGVEDREIPGPAGPIPARVVRPTSGPIRGVALQLHGGGWCIGTARSGDAASQQIADATGLVVLSIDYRLAPEHPFPAGPDDCEAAARWLVEHAEAEWGAAPLVIGGGSAGAHLALLTLLRLRDAADGTLERYLGANLMFGCYDLGFTPSARDSHDALVIPRAMLDACMAHALPGLDADARRDPSISPLFADLSGLPPLLLTVGTLDPLLDDSLFLAARAGIAGTTVEIDVYPECVHGFPSFPTELARIANDRMAAWVGARLHDA